MFRAVGDDHQFVRVVAESHERRRGARAVVELDDRRQNVGHVVGGSPRAVLLFVGDSLLFCPDQLAHQLVARNVHPVVLVHSDGVAHILVLPEGVENLGGEVEIALYDSHAVAEGDHEKPVVGHGETEEARWPGSNRRSAFAPFNTLDILEHIRYFALHFDTLGGVRRILQTESIEAGQEVRVEYVVLVDNRVGAVTEARLVVLPKNFRKVCVHLGHGHSDCVPHAEFPEFLVRNCGQEAVRRVGKGLERGDDLPFSAHPVDVTHFVVPDSPHVLRIGGRERNDVHRSAVRDGL